ncbi:hypothetical protein GCM10025857_09070 [Alicyclobacillus contaminans]|nr:hypothetical protein GCM10025857_09070 [Alicyclobacillus contaminans]
MLISLLRRAIGQIVERSRSALADAKRAPDKLRALVSLYFRELGDHRDLAMVTQVHLRQVDANIRRQIGDIMKPFYNMLDEIVEQGIEEGIFRRQINRRLARRMIFGTMDETVTAWVLPGGKYHLHSLADDVVDLLLHGLAGSASTTED